MANYNPHDKKTGYTERKLNTSDLIVSKTDKKGTILYANPTMAEITGMSQRELIGQPHNIVRHPDMPRAIFKLMWSEIEAGRSFYGYVKNLARDGSFYWTFAFVTPDYDTKGNVIGYHSERRAPNPAAVSTIVPIYQRLKEKELALGIDQALKWWEESVLNGKPYPHYIHDLQNTL